jgi:hypothetical protein
MPYYVTVESKVCKDCGIEKPANEFNRQPGNRDGLIRRCKSCERIFRERYKGRYGRVGKNTALVESPI